MRGSACAGGNGERERDGGSCADERAAHMLASMPLWDSVAGLDVCGWTATRSSAASSAPRPAGRASRRRSSSRAAARRGRGRTSPTTRADHDDVPAGLALAGTRTLGELSQLLDEVELWSHEPEQEAAHRLPPLGVRERRARPRASPGGVSLAGALGREERPVRFVVSTRAAIEDWLAAAPGMEFKLDVEERLGPGADGAARGARPRPRRRSEGVLPRHERRSRPRPGAVPRGGGVAARGRDRGPVARGRLPRGARRRRGARSASTRPSTRSPTSTRCRSRRAG